MLHRTLVALVAAPLLAASAGCTKSNPDTQTPEEAPAVAPAEAPIGPPPPEEEVLPPEEEVSASAPEPAVASLNDGEILGVVETIHRAEIDQADLARSRGRTAAVKSFAERMIKEHGEAERRLDALSVAMGMHAMDSDLCESTRADAQSKTEALMAMEAGDAFDRQYIDVQVELHAEGLKILDERLIPAATNEALRDELTKVRELVVDHFARAQEIQAELTAAPQT